jgi:hypothetical protein
VTDLDFVDCDHRGDEVDGLGCFVSQEEVIPVIR